MDINKMLRENPIMIGPFPIIDSSTVKEKPLEQFQAWFKHAVDTKVAEPNSMVLSTDDNTRADSRVVLLKAMDETGFYFETAKARTKVEQLARNSNVALNFYWREHGRQIRVKGHAILTDDFSHVKSNLDASTRDLNVYKVAPTEIEFYQALNTGGYTRIIYTLQDNVWQYESI